MFRKPGAGRSRASADTLCQKCLKRGHYSYECKVTAQERPYVSRPSRTQQLLNPKLQPKLTTELPAALLPKKGVADEILKKKEDDRDRTSRKRSRSSSTDSVSTISTNRSPSRSPSPRRRRRDAPPKRSRRSVSIDSRSSSASHDRERNTRRRMSSFSPGERGRRRTRSRSQSGSSRVHNKARSGSRPVGEARSTSRRNHGSRTVHVTKSRSRSPDCMDTSDDRNGAPRGRWGASPPPTRSLEPLRGKQSPSPYSTRRAPSPHRGRNGYGGRGAGNRNMGSMGYDHGGGGFGGARSRFDDGPVDRNGRNGPPPAQPPPVQRERSLSPFSKRVALTRAMHTGHL